MKNLLPIISEKLVINKHSKVKGPNNIKHYHWANMYNILCYLWLDTNIIYDLRDTTNNKGDIYYISFNIDRKNVHPKDNWENRSFFKEVRDNVYPVNYRDEKKLYQSLSKKIGKEITQLYIFVVKEYFNSLLLGILLYTDNNENIIYLISANQEDLEKITKTFIKTDNWDIYSKNIGDNFI